MLYLMSNDEMKCYSMQVGDFSASGYRSHQSRADTNSISAGAPDSNVANGCSAS